MEPGPPVQPRALLSRVLPGAVQVGGRLGRGVWGGGGRLGWVAAVEWYSIHLAAIASICTPGAGEQVGKPLQGL